MCDQEVWGETKGARGQHKNVSRAILQSHTNSWNSARYGNQQLGNADSSTSRLTLWGSQTKTLRKYNNMLPCKMDESQISAAHKHFLKYVERCYLKKYICNTKSKKKKARKVILRCRFGFFGILRCRIGFGNSRLSDVRGAFRARMFKEWKCRWPASGVMCQRSASEFGWDKKGTECA